MKDWLLIVLQLVVVFFVSCDEDHDQELRVSTLETSAITESTAQSGGKIISDGGEEILQQGLCWSTLPNPTTEDSLTIGSPGSEFAILIVGLKSKTTYYVRAFARTNTTTAYGNEVSFTTLGYEGWESFDSSNSALPSNNIQRITVDKNGVAWIGAENYLVRFDGESFTSYKFAEPTPYAGVQNVYVDSHDNKWIDATSGLYKFDNTNFEKFDAVRGLFVEKDTLWTVRATQLEKVQIGTGALISCVVTDTGLGDEDYYELKRDLKGRYLACVKAYKWTASIQMSESGFCAAENLGPNIWESYPKLTVSPDSLVYFTTATQGFGIMKKDFSFEFIDPYNSALPSAYTHDIAGEGDGSKVWIACNLWRTPIPNPHVDEGGLVEYSPTLGIVNVYNTSNSGLVNNHVISVAVMNNKILAGTDKGLSVYTR